MTLYEAIKHEGEVAKENEELYRLCPASESDLFYCNGTKDCRALKNGKNKGCQKRAEEHRQLAEWLCQLKQIKDIVQEYHDNYIEWGTGQSSIAFHKIVKIIVGGDGE